MEVPDRRERKKNRTRVAIQQAAFDLFAERGYRDTTINAIADRADVAPRTVTVHFSTKEELLFDLEPFTLEGLTAALRGRTDGTSALDALRGWMASSITDLAEADPVGRFWARRALRARIIEAEPDLRGRARSGYHVFERILAEQIGVDIGQPGTALTPRLAALTAVIGLREIYETDEARRLPAPPKPAELIALVDRVIAFATAGVATTR